MPAAGCYFGCRTTYNRVLWTAFAGLLAIALGLALTAGFVASTCNESFDRVESRYSDVVTAVNETPEQDESMCRDAGMSEDSPGCIELRAQRWEARMAPGLSAQERRCHLSGAAFSIACMEAHPGPCYGATVTAAFTLLMGLIIPIPLYFMCCCSQPPHGESAVKPRLAQTAYERQVSSAQGIGSRRLVDGYIKASIRPAEAERQQRNLLSTFSDISCDVSEAEGHSSVCQAPVYWLPQSPVAGARQPSSPEGARHASPTATPPRQLLSPFVAAAEASSGSAASSRSLTGGRAVGDFKMYDNQMHWQR